MSVAEHPIPEQAGAVPVTGASEGETLFDLDALRDAVVKEDPYRYLVVPDFVRPDALAAIRGDFPDIRGVGPAEPHEIASGPSFGILMYRSLIYLSVIIVTGCADTHKLTRTSVTTAPLSRDASAYVALPADGRYGDRLYQSSGAQTAQEVVAAFAPYVSRVSVATSSESVAEAVGSAQEGGYDYVIVSQILHWEDRATEWSGRPDQVSIKISVMRADTGDVLDSGIIEGTSGVATFGGDHPQDLLSQPLHQYSASLFDHPH